MGYRIRYGERRKLKWLGLGVSAGVLLWSVGELGTVWSSMAAGEGLYDALARFVGGMILGTN